MSVSFRHVIGALFRQWGFADSQGPAESTTGVAAVHFSCLALPLIVLFLAGMVRLGAEEIVESASMTFGGITASGDGYWNWDIDYFENSAQAKFAVLPPGAMSLDWSFSITESPTDVSGGQHWASAEDMLVDQGALSGSGTAIIDTSSLVHVGQAAIQGTTGYPAGTIVFINTKLTVTGSDAIGYTASVGVPHSENFPPTAPSKVEVHYNTAVFKLVDVSPVKMVAVGQPVVEFTFQRVMAGDPKLGVTVTQTYWESDARGYSDGRYIDNGKLKTLTLTDGCTPPHEPPPVPTPQFTPPRIADSIDEVVCSGW